MRKSQRSATIKKIIHVLAHHVESRDCDRVLMTEFFLTFHPEEFKNGWMAPGALTRMTNPDDIVRLRAVVQNDMGLYLPTSPEIRHKRRQSEEAWRDWVKLSRNKTRLAEINSQI